jgi:hypothetical protein
VPSLHTALTLWRPLCNCSPPIANILVSTTAARNFFIVILQPRIVGFRGTVTICLLPYNINLRLKLLFQHENGYAELPISRVTGDLKWHFTFPINALIGQYSSEPFLSGEPLSYH